MAIKISGSTIIDDSRNIVNAGVTTAGALTVGNISGDVTSGDLEVTPTSLSATVVVGRLSSTSNDNTTFRIRDRVDNTLLSSSPAIPLEVGRNGSEYARIDYLGRVGLGTSNPSATVHVSVDDPQFRLQRTGAYSTSAGPLIQFQGKGPDGTNYNFAKIQAVSSGSNNAGELQLFTNSSGSQTERLRIADDGKLSLTGGTANMQYLQMGGSNLDRGLTFTSSSGASSIGVVHTINAPGDGGSQGEIVFQTNSSESFRITPTGVVDINAGGQANTFKVEDLTSGRVVFSGTGGELEDSADLQFSGTQLFVGVHCKAQSLEAADVTQGSSSLALRALGTGANDGFLKNESTTIMFSNRRTGDGASGNVSYIKTVAEGDQASSWPTSLAFGVRRFGSQPAETLRLQSDGHVGIGTSAPVGQLQVTTGSLGGGVIIDHEGGSPYHSKVINDSGDLIVGSRNTSADTIITSQRKTYIRSGSGEGIRITCNENGATSVGNKFRVGYLQMITFFGSTTGVWDTGFSINQSNGGGTSLLIAARNTGAGTATQSAIYQIKWNYDGNNAPSTTLISGSNFCTFSTTASNTLGISGNIANWVMGLIHVSNLNF